MYKQSVPITSLSEACQIQQTARPTLLDATSPRGSVVSQSCCPSIHYVALNLWVEVGMRNRLQMAMPMPLSASVPFARFFENGIGWHYAFELRAE